MRNGIAISTLLHMGVVAAAIYGLPELLEPPQLEQPIIVELVTVAERTVSQKPPEPSPKKAPPPAPKLKPVATPEPEPEPEPKPEPPKKVAKVSPPPPPPEPAKAETPPPPKPAPTPEAKPVKVVTPKPKPPEKPKVKPKARPKKIAMAAPPKAFRTLPRPKQKPKRRRPKFSADRIAALLDKDDRKKQSQTQQKATEKRTAAKPPPAVAPNRNQVRTQPMTMSEIDAIRYQIQQCWTIPAGARDAENLVVRIRVFLNTDGSLAKAPEIVGTGQGNDPFYRTAAESARRAVQKCAPLKGLPADKYARWRELTLTFNPRDMLGG